MLDRIITWLSPGRRKALYGFAAGATALAAVLEVAAVTGIDQGVRLCDLSPEERRAIVASSAGQS